VGQLPAEEAGGPGPAADVGDLPKAGEAGRAEAEAPGNGLDGPGARL
jgi:hypothetical protein